MYGQKSCGLNIVGQMVFGQNDIGRNVIGRNVFGRIVLHPPKILGLLKFFIPFCFVGYQYFIDSIIDTRSILTNLMWLRVRAFSAYVFRKL